MEEKNSVLKMYKSALKSYFSGDAEGSSYYYITSCTLKMVLLEAFEMDEKELQGIEDSVRELSEE